MAKKECTKENILAADKERDFGRIVQSHPKWMRQEHGKGSHRKEIYQITRDEQDGEAPVAWAAHHGEVSVGVRRKFIAIMIAYGLLVQGES